jgi:hypothetical protein
MNLRILNAANPWSQQIGDLMFDDVTEIRDRIKLGEAIIEYVESLPLDFCQHIATMLDKRETPSKGIGEFLDCIEEKSTTEAAVKRSIIRLYRITETQATIPFDLAKKYEVLRRKYEPGSYSLTIAFQFIMSAAAKRAKG